MKQGLTLFLLVSMLSACGGKVSDFIPGTAQKPAAGSSDNALYSKGKDALNDGDYDEAISYFEEIERTYPFSSLAAKSQVMTAYAHYQDRKYDSAITVIDRFTQLNPGNENVPYMQYLKALSYYDRIADVKRDQHITEEARQALETVVNRYSESEYAADAAQKLNLVKDHLAGKQMEIGRYYLEDKKYIAAVNRFKKVVDEYQTTAHVPEALHRLVEGYLLLGLPEEAQMYGAVLGHNYADSQWYNRSYKLLKK